MGITLQRYLCPWVDQKAQGEIYFWIWMVAKQKQAKKTKTKPKRIDLRKNKFCFMHKLHKMVILLCWLSSLRHCFFILNLRDVKDVSS